jgi:hypothetical protein
VRIADMNWMQVWQIAVDEPRALLTGSWGDAA